MSTAYSQNIKAIYPVFTTKDQWMKCMQVVAPTMEEVWSNDFKEMFVGVFDWNGMLYVCAYPLNPQNFALKEKFEEWKLLDLEGRAISLAKLNTNEIPELLLTGVVLRSDFSYVQSPFYFGRPIPINAEMGDSVRIVLPGIKMAFDYAPKTKKLMSVLKITETMSFEKVK